MEVGGASDTAAAPAHESPKPRVLCAHTSAAPPLSRQTELWEETLDYSVYQRVPRAWRALEERLRLDIWLAHCVNRDSRDFDVIWCGSERVAIPLALLRPNRPLVVLTHNLGSAAKRRLLRLAGVQRRWSRVAYFCEADREVLEAKLGFAPERLFRFVDAPLDRFLPAGDNPDGPILAAGVAKRDYPTLLAALRSQNDCHAEIFASSRYGDELRGNLPAIPAWVRLETPVSNDEMVQHYARAAFVAVPLLESTQFGAGCTAITEAAAAGKAVIATRTPGTVDFVVDGVTGILVPPGDVGAFARALRRLKDSPGLTAEMGRQARLYVERRFTPEERVRPALAAIRAAHIEWQARRI